ncbi:MAG: histidine phosphatase family protein [Egibacteraceae bacterium]
MAETTRIVLIRHGDAQMLIDQVVGGHEGCRGLSALGVRQAEALRDRLARTGELGHPSALYASVLARAVQTAQIIAPALGAPPVVTDCSFCEIHVGEGDGMPWEEFELRYPPPADPDPFASPSGGETWAEFTLRVAGALRRLVLDHRGETVVVVCHGGVVGGSMIALLGLPFHGAMVDLHVENTSITQWQLDHHQHVPGRPPRWSLVRYNDAAHLAEVDADRV